MCGLKAYLGTAPASVQTSRFLPIFLHCSVLTLTLFFGEAIMDDLAKTYSREQQRLGNELNEPTVTPSLARQLSQGREWAMHT